jgi:hypothetical protein
MLQPFLLVIPRVLYNFLHDLFVLDIIRARGLGLRLPLNRAPTKPLIILLLALNEHELLGVAFAGDEIPSFEILLVVV